MSDHSFEIVSFFTTGKHFIMFNKEGFVSTQMKVLFNNLW